MFCEIILVSVCSRSVVYYNYYSLGFRSSTHVFVVFLFFQICRFSVASPSYQFPWRSHLTCFYRLTRLFLFSGRTCYLLSSLLIYILYLVLLRSWCKCYFIWILFLFVRFIIIFYIIIWVVFSILFLLGLLRVLVVLNLPIP